MSSSSSLESNNSIQPPLLLLLCDEPNEPKEPKKSYKKQLEKDKLDSTHSHRSNAWNLTYGGGTILSDPIFNNTIDVEYRGLNSPSSSSSFSRTYSDSYSTTKRLGRPTSNSSEMDTFDSLKSPTPNGEKITKPRIFDKDYADFDETQRLVGPNCRPSFDGTIQDDYEKDIESDKNQLCNLNLYKGILYSSLSSVFFSLSAVIVKYLKDIHPGQLAVSRFFGIFILTIPLIVYHDLNPLGPVELRPILIMRGIAGATSLFLRFISFHYLPIADASVIIFSVPVFVSIFAWFYLKEPCGLFHTFTIMIAMIGLIMTTKLPILFGNDASIIYSNNYYYYNQVPTNISAIQYYQNVTSNWMNQSASIQTQRINHLYGVISALSSLIFSSSVFILIRKAKGAHHAVIMFNFGWVAIIETTIITSILNGFSMPRTPFEWYLIVALSVFSFCGQMLLTRSLQLEQAGPVSVVRATTDIALAFIWQVTIFNEIPDMWSICGALVVSSCIVLVALRKFVLSLPDHSKLRDKFYLLLI